MKASIKGFIMAVGIVISLATYVVGEFTREPSYLYIALMMLFLFSVFRHFHRDSANTFAFFITFFSFLMGTIVLSVGESGYFGLASSNLETIMHVLRSLYLALFAFDMGTMLANRKHFSFTYIRGLKTPRTKNNEPIDEYIQRASRIFYYFTSICAMALSLEKVVFYMVGGDYAAYYLSFKSSLPSFVDKIGQVNIAVLFIYLATLPDPKKSKYILGSFLFIGFMGLMYGQRNQIIMNIIIMCLYCMLYENHTNQQYRIIKKRYYVIAMIALPVALLFLDFFMYYREGRSYQFNGAINSIRNLFNNLGGSVNVITYGFEYNTSFPVGKMYSLGHLIDFLSKNVVTKLIFGTEIYHDQTVEMALYGNSFGQTITYLVRPEAYLSGHGMGSCFIAEAYHDLGYLGIALFGAVYGAILKNSWRLRKGHWVRNTILLMANYHILYSPRDAADLFIAGFLNFSFLAMAVLIYLVAVHMKGRRISTLMLIAKET